MKQMKAITVYTLVTLLFVWGGLSVPTVEAETAAAGTYKIDPEHSFVLFSVSHLGISISAGRFNDFEGNIILAPGKNSKVELTVKTASVDTYIEKRDKHLRGPDFLDTKQFPIMRFVSSKVEYNAAGEPVKLTGELFLHGKTNTVSFTVKPIGAGKDPWGGYRAGYQANTVIKRSDFGMKYMLGGVGDEIDITLNIEAIKQ